MLLSPNKNEKEIEVDSRNSDMALCRLYRSAAHHLSIQWMMMYAGQKQYICVVFHKVLGTYIC